MKKTLFLLLFWFNTIHAWDLLEALNSRAKITKPGAFYSASAGYIYRGGVSMRTHHTIKNLANISLPTIKSGCGGIDFFGGSMSMITGQELVNMAKNLIKSTPPYAMHLALKVYSPQIESVMTHLEDITTRVNQANIDTCKQIQAGFAAFLPNGSFKRAACEEYGTGDGMDFFKAAQKCRVAADADAMLKGKEEIAYVPTAQNIIYEAAKKAGVSAVDDREILMSLVGTIILHEDTNTKQIKPILYPSLVKAVDLSFEENLRAKYVCDEREKCLMMNNRSIPTGSPISLISLKERITKIIRQLLENIKASKNISEDSIEFLESSYSIAPIHEWLFIVAKGAIGAEALENIVPEYIYLQYIAKTLHEAALIVEKEALNYLSLKETFQVLKNQIALLQDATQNQIRKKEKLFKEREKDFDKAAKKIKGGYA